MSAGLVVSLLALVLVAASLAAFVPMLLLARLLSGMIDEILERKLAALRSLDEQLDAPDAQADEEEEDIVE